MNAWKYDSDEDYYEALAINHEDQSEPDDDDYSDEKYGYECDLAAEIHFRALMYRY